MAKAKPAKKAAPAKKTAPAKKPAAKAVATKKTTAKATKAAKPVSKKTAVKKPTAKAKPAASPKPTASVAPAKKAPTKVTLKSNKTVRVSKEPKDASKTIKLSAKATAKAAKEAAEAAAKAAAARAAAAKAIQAAAAKPVKMTPFLKQQRERLLALRDTLLDSMQGVAKDTLRSRAEGSEASAFGMHQADAGSDAYDRDFALSLLSQEQDALHEIEQALKRIDLGTYGTCEMSGKPIVQARLEALPFARYTVECQSQFEKQRRIQRSRTAVTSLFGLTENESSEDDDDSEEEPTPASEKQE